MKNTVFRSGQARLAAKYALFFDTLLIHRKTRPQSSPSSTRGTIQVKAVPRGLMLSSMEPKDPPIKHWIRLVIPKTRPQTAPPSGPKMIAPTATGTVRNVIDRPGVRKYPSGVKAISQSVGQGAEVAAGTVITVQMGQTSNRAD